MTAPALMFAAWCIEALLGWPNQLFRYVRHPVVWIGGLINWLDTTLNRTTHPKSARYAFGLLASVTTIAIVTGAALAISIAIPETWWGFAIEALLASSLIASRGLYQHVAAVRDPLQRSDLAGARQAVARIVGRDPTQLDQSGIARSSLESLAENASDGVVAPIFWGCRGLSRTKRQIRWTP